MNIITYLALPNQHYADSLEQYAASHGMSIMQRFVDESTTLPAKHRPALQKLIALSQQQHKNFDAILVYSADQFIEDQVERSAYVYLLQKHNISLITISGTEDIAPAVHNIDAVWKVAEDFQYMRFKYTAVKSMEVNAKRGFHNGGRPPFGYRTMPVGNRMTFVLGPEEEVAIVRQIFELASQGYGGKAIARQLNAEGIIVGRKWAPSTALSILDNQAYLGHRVWKTHSDLTITKHCHPAIVSEELWNSAHNLLEGRKQQ